MARRRRVFAPGVLYHVIVQGNQREKTFTSDGDYQVYLERLAKYRRQFSNDLILEDQTVAFSSFSGDSGLPTRRIPIAFRRINHTFFYLYPRDT
jgi:hypothetical protein